MATANTWKSAAKVSKLGINPPRMAIYRKFTIFHPKWTAFPDTC